MIMMAANESDTYDSEGSGASDYLTDDDDISFNSDSDDDDCVELSEESLIQVKCNDPALTSLRVNWAGSGFANSVDWKVEGKFIGDNTNLEKLDLSYFEFERSFFNIGRRDKYAWKKFEDFCRGVAANRSVKNLIISDSYLSDEGAFSSLSECLENNGNLSSIEISDCQLCSDAAHLLASTLSRRSNKSSLKKISFRGCDIGGEDDSEELMTALTGHHNLVKLYLRGNNIGLDGCITLVNLLKDPQCNLRKLDLQRNGLDNKCSTTLANGLARNRSLKLLDLSNNPYMIPKLRAFSPTLKGLNLRRSNINDRGITSLGSALENNSTLKILNLSWNNSITSVGWRAFSTCLQSTESALEKLSITDNNIDDEGATAIANSLINNTTLKHLSASSNSLVSAGWWSLSTNLQNPSSALEILDLSRNNVNDEVVIACANALAHNTSLRILSIGFNPGLTARSWDALSNSICNQSTLESIYESNHVLQEIPFRSPVTHLLFYPGDLLSLLELNEDTNKSEVARQKILKYHFLNGNSNLEVFVDMELAVVPPAIAWIGRNSSGRSLMYQLLRSMPSLFDFEAKAKATRAKRKRGI